MIKYTLLLIVLVDIAFAYEVHDSKVLDKILAYSFDEYDGFSQVLNFQKKSPIPFSINISRNLKSTQLSKIQIEQGGDAISLIVHPSALKNSWVTQEIIEEMRGLHYLNQSADFYIYKELLLNSKLGDSNAKKGLLGFEESAMYRAHQLQNSPSVFYLREGVHSKSDYENYLQIRILDLVNRRKSINNSKKVEVDITKINHQSISKEVHTLALNNDRKGVANLLKSSIPWDFLTETERRAYKNFISSIEVPSKDTVILFKGIGRDKKKDVVPSWPLLSVSIQNGVLNEEILHFRSNARAAEFYLPDFESREWKWNHIDSFVAGARHHGAFAKTTPYISATSSIDVALDFSQQGHQKSDQRRVLLIEIDQRRLLPNIVSQFNEYEYLVPFLIFSDEIKEDITGTDIQIRKRIRERISSYRREPLESFKQKGQLFFQKIIQDCSWLLQSPSH